MPEVEAARALELAGQVHELVLDIDARLIGVDRRERRTRKLTWAVAAVAAVAVALGVALGLVAAAQGRQQAEIRQSQLVACGIGNESRAAQRQLWDHVIAISAAPRGETAAQRARRLAQVAAFRAYIARHFAPVGCARLYGR